MFITKNFKKKRKFVLYVKALSFKLVVCTTNVCSNMTNDEKARLIMKYKYRFIRYLSQSAFFGFILWSTLGKTLFVGGRPLEIHSICPFGAIETLPTFIASSGASFIRETGIGNFTIFISLILSIFVFGGAFCGWVCPVGAVSEWFFRFRLLFFKKTITVPDKLHKVLRWLRYVVLAVILVMTLQVGELWFGRFDPFLNLFFFRIINIVGLSIVGFVVIGSMFVERFFCRYLCPLGGVIHPFAKLSATGIKRNEDICTKCQTCSSVCPYQIPVDSQVKIDRGSCISCMRCVEECPTQGSLDFYIGW